MATIQQPRRPTTFFDLPQELRDKVYALFPFLATINITEHPSRGLLQPNISRVCRQMRKESLDVFYNHNRFLLDLRGWKGEGWSRALTPGDIFRRWITAIGDENVARLRCLSFFCKDFRVNIRISSGVPPTLKMRFRTDSSGTSDVSVGIPHPYSYTIAAGRLEQGLEMLLADIQFKALHRSVTVEDLACFFEAVNKAQPFLCKRLSLGAGGVALLTDGLSVDEWPSTEQHLKRCDDCASQGAGHGDS